MRVGVALLAASALLVLTSCSIENRVDPAAEARAVRELSRRWLTAEIAKDVPTIVSFYAPDAVEMASNTPLIRGREAIREWYKTWLLPTGIGMTFATTDVAVSKSGDLAVEQGTYAFTQTGPRGSTQDVGKYVTVWKKVDGKWMVAIDTATSDRPCAAP